MSTPVSDSPDGRIRAFGLLAWAAGTDSSGLHVVTVWQSKAHQDRWAAEQLLPAFQSLGLTDVASNTEFVEYDADELYIR